MVWQSRWVRPIAVVLTALLVMPHHGAATALASTAVGVSPTAIPTAALESPARAHVLFPQKLRKRQAVYVELRTRQVGKSRYLSRLKLTRSGIVRIKYYRVSTKGKKKSLGKWKVLLRGVAPGVPYVVESATTNSGSVVVLASRMWRTDGPTSQRWVSRKDRSGKRLTQPGSVGAASWGTRRARAAQVTLVRGAAAGAATTTEPAPSTTAAPPRARQIGSPGTASSVPALTLPPASLGGVLPSRRALTDAQRVYVAPAGSDSATGAAGSPVRTLTRALQLVQPGGQVILRGGRYPVSGNAGSIYRDKKGITVTNYPGEIPVLDGSVGLGAPRSESADVVSFAYRQVPAGLGEGMNLNWLPAATFDSRGATGLAKARGWECVARDGKGHVPPRPTSTDPDGCASDRTARVTTAYYPDQAWAGGQKLVQVLSRSMVRPGFFFVDRGPDADATATRIYLSTEDAAKSPLRVSAPSTFSMIQVDAPDVTINGLRFFGFSGPWGVYPLHVYKTGHRLTVRDTEFVDPSGVAVKAAGWATTGGADILNDLSLRRVRISDPGWKGISARYVTGLTLEDIQVAGSNRHAEFGSNSALHITHTHRTTVRSSVVKDSVGIGAWWDQSSYDTRVVASRFHGNSSHQIFYEFSHAATLVGNLLVGGRTDAALRLSGASSTMLVNNTVVGGRDSIWIYVDGRARSYFDSVHGERRWCAEHRVRYGESGDAARDCSVTFTSDFDLARPGSFGPTNQTPGLNWRVSMSAMVNNVVGPSLADGHCVINVPMCVTGYTEFGGVRNSIPMKEIVPSTSIWDGNVYQTSGQLLQFWGGPNLPGLLRPSTILAVQDGLGGSYYNLSRPDWHALQGTGWTNAQGLPTPTLSAKHAWAAPSPGHARITSFLPAGSRHYGAYWP